MRSCEQQAEEGLEELPEMKLRQGDMLMRTFVQSEDCAVATSPQRMVATIMAKPNTEALWCAILI